MRGIPGLSKDLLASQEELCPIELFSYLLCGDDIEPTLAAFPTFLTSWHSKLSGRNGYRIFGQYCVNLYTNITSYYYKYRLKRLGQT